MNSVIADEERALDAKAARSRWSVDQKCSAAMLAIWVCIIIVVNPVGNFPIGDDFGFAPPVWTLLETGRLKLTDWGAMNLASQVAWGAVFSAFLGKTYTALRISTLVLGGLGALALYRLLRVSLTPAQALLGTLVLSVNPLYLTTSFTFLTDTPYTAMQMIAVWLLVTGWERESRWRLGVGWLMAAAALLCRQTGLVIPIAAAVAFLAAKPVTMRRVLMALAPILALFALQRGYRDFLIATDGAPANFGVLIDVAADKLNSNLILLAIRYVQFASYAWMYLGIFLLPLCVATVAEARVVGSRWRLFLAAAMLAGVGVLFLTCVGQPRLFPYFAGTWQVDYGLGTEFTGATVSIELRAVETVIAMLGGGLLIFVTALAIARLRPRLAPAQVFGLFLALGLVAPIPLLGSWWDRYIIPAIPCAILVLGPALRHLKPRALAAGFAFAAALGAFSVASVHDFMAFKRAQWQAYTDLRRTVAADRIDASWSINGVHSLKLFMTEVRPLACWHTSQEYIIWPGDDRPAHTPIARYPVARWVPWNRKDPDVYTLRALYRLPADAAGRQWASCGQ